MHNLTYTQFKHQIKKIYNINVDDLPVYKIGIIKYFYKLQNWKAFDYIREVIKNGISN